MNIFKNTKLTDFDYERYWKERDVEIRKKLLDRERLFFHWIKPESRVLDVAAGNSLLPRVLKEQKQCAVSIFDISERVLAAQKSNGIHGERVDLSAGDFSLNKEYDYVILSEILEHLPLPETVIKKVAPHTKYLVISIPNSAFYRFRAQVALGGRFMRQWVTHPSEHLRFWSHTDFLDWLSVFGLEVVEATASNGLDIGPVKFYRWLPNLFGHQMAYLCKKKAI